MLCRLLMPGAAAFLGVALSACVSTDVYQKERAEMNERVTALSAEVARNATLLAETRKQFKEFQECAAREKKKEDLESVSLRELFDNMEYGNIPAHIVGRYLDLITPPANATPEQKRKFIENISGMRINFNSERLRNRITNSLVALGHEYFEDLLANAVNSQYLRDAAKRLAKPSDKPLLKRLLLSSGRQRYPALDIYVSLIDENDKADVLKLLPDVPELSRCVTRLGIEKEAVPVLKKQLLQNRNSNFEALEVVLNQLAPEERQDFMAKFWSLYGNIRSNTWKCNLAIMLARKGFVPAFCFLVEKSQDFRKNPNHWKYIWERLQNLTSFTDMDSLEKWYRENKNQIVFNSEKELYEAKK